MPKGMPAAVRSQLRLQRMRREVARDIEPLVISQSDKDLKAELDSMRDPVTPQLVLQPQIEAITLETSAKDRPEGVAMFYLETWPRLIYANPAVRFNVQLHYTRSHLLRANRALEQKAAELEKQNVLLMSHIAGLTETRDNRRRRKANKMGITESEMEKVPDAEDEQDAAKLQNLSLTTKANEDEAARLRASIQAPQRLDGQEPVEDLEAATAAAIAQAKRPPTRAEDDAGEDAQVVGPLTPESVVQALRAKQPVDYPIRHGLDILWRGRTMGASRVDLPADPTTDHIALLQKAGLGAPDRSRPTAPIPEHLPVQPSSITVTVAA